MFAHRFFHTESLKHSPSRTTGAKNLPLRTKILAFALFLVAFTVLVALCAFLQRHSLSASVHAAELQAELLKAHHSKSKYIYRRSTDDADDAEEYLLRSVSLLVYFEREEATQHVRSKMQQYLTEFRHLQENMRQRGVNENSGAEGEFRRSIHAAQELIRELGQSEIEITILQTRRREKDYFMRGDESYIGEVRQLVLRAQQQIAQSPRIIASDKQRLTKFLASYIQTFEQTATLLGDIQKSDARLNIIMEHIQPSLARIVAAKQAQAETVGYIVWAVMLISLLSSTLLAFWIAHHFSKPIMKLEQAAQHFAEGNHDITVKIRSRDEVGRLAEAFNMMIANVRKRTQELQDSNDELLQANTVIQQQKEMLEEQTVLVSRTNLELSNANMELRMMNNELEQANNEKNEFLGIAAHDLKNPLAGMRGLVAMLEHSHDRLTMKDVEETAQILSRAIEKMFTIIKNLLDINAIETGNMRLQSEVFDVATVVADVVADYRNRADEKGITLYFDAPFYAMHAIGDSTATMQVIDNIVSNAVKYSPSGRNIWVRVLKSSHGIRVEVQDEGPGLSEDDKKRLFGKFVRLSAQPTGNEHSTGLGLSIVKRMIEGMNGRVWCESELGKGATFLVMLPCPPATLTREQKNDIIVMQPA
ncbi:MAG: sensor histidine kinase [Candidatus Kapaibacterium sp.]|nr:MAG: sensor histidine kinase [Candidatus Kapabacteria bacterium]